MSAPRILRSRDVRERTGLATSSVYDLIKRGNFPRPVRISARSVGWPENEIDDFIADRIAARDAKVAAQ
jgi:prophage regulatory protein